MGYSFRHDEKTAVVKTKCGVIRGYTCGGVSVYKGIPYAKAKRFHSPEPAEKWEGELDATNYGYVCPLLELNKPNISCCILRKTEWKYRKYGSKNRKRKTNNFKREGTKMAVLDMVYRSESLHKNVRADVIVPAERTLKSGEKQPYKTLYLLHGLTGGGHDWLYHSSIVRYAEENNFVVVMPDSPNRYYIDNPVTGEMFGEFVGKEMVELTRNMFPLSDKREDTCIGGFSMGGYGAFRLGLKYYETFGSIISFAGGFRYRHMDQFTEGRTFAESPGFFEAVYGDLEKIKGSEIDLEALAGRLKERNQEFPGMYLAVGTEDRLLEDERQWKAYLETIGEKLTYEEGPGNHTWDFVGTFLPRAIEWWLKEA